MSSYDEIPYTSNPFFSSTPAHCYTLARLFRLTPRHFATAKVLELGCASGGNIIPLAYRFPQASFVGIDLSNVQVQAGQQQVDALNLDNISLRHQSILELDRSEGLFDYIICHGVFSWVDARVQDKILALCDELLSETGVAYVSYNTFPGWNFVRVIRDMMRFHVRGLTDPKNKAAQARSILEFVLVGLRDDDEPYANFLRSEARNLAQQEDYYLLHEQLEDENNPVYFTEFMDLVYRHNLQYLGDANLSTMFVGNLPPETGKHLAELTDIVQTEQYMDFIHNRRFRSSVLCRKGQQIQRDLNASDLSTFYLSTRLKAPADFGVERLSDASMQRFSIEHTHLDVDHPVSKHAIYQLIEQHGKPIHFDDLSKRLGEHLDLPTDQVSEHLLHDLHLLRLVLGGVVDVHAEGSDEPATVSAYPRASAVARLQAASQAHVTTLRHQSVPLSDAERILLRYLDGAHTQADLVGLVIGHIDGGDLQIHSQNPENGPNLDINREIERLIPELLDRFRHIGLLEA
ncbi:MAG: class I SAM-dependent methyltransferase [Gammaproteobacteria bacterium]|nr:class I SAM-dependent methyltransferase [Gammaproteobacteria bacterium]